MPLVPGGSFRGPCHGRSASWTKFEPEPAVSFVRAALIGFKYTARLLGRRLRQSTLVSRTHFPSSAGIECNDKRRLYSAHPRPDIERRRRGSCLRVFLPFQYSLATSQQLFQSRFVQVVLNMPINCWVPCEVSESKHRTDAFDLSGFRACILIAPKLDIIGSQ